MEDTDERFYLKKKILSATSAQSENENLNQFQKIANIMYRSEKRPDLPVICECISFYSSWLRKSKSNRLKTEILLILGDLSRLSVGLDSRIYFESALEIAENDQLEQIYTFLSICAIENGNLLEALKHLLTAVCKFSEQDSMSRKNLKELCSSCISSGLEGFERFIVLIILTVYSSKDRDLLLKAVKITEMNREESKVFALLWDFLLSNQGRQGLRLESVVGHMIRQLLLSCHSNPVLSRIFLLNFDRVIEGAKAGLKEELSYFLKRIVKEENQELKEKLVERGLLVRDPYHPNGLILPEWLMQEKAQLGLNVQFSKVQSEKSPVQEWIVPDASVLISGWPNLVCSHAPHGLVITKAVLEELDYQKLVNPQNRETIQQILKFVDKQVKESPDLIKLLSKPIESASGSIKTIRGLYKYHLEMIQSVIAAESKGCFEGKKVIFVSNSEVFIKALDENNLRHVKPHQRTPKWPN